MADVATPSASRRVAVLWPCRWCRCVASVVALFFTLQNIPTLSRGLPITCRTRALRGRGVLGVRGGEQLPQTLASLTINTSQTPTRNNRMYTHGTADLPTSCNCEKIRHVTAAEPASGSAGCSARTGH